MAPLRAVEGKESPFWLARLVVTQLKVAAGIARLRSSLGFNIGPAFGRFWGARALSLMGDYAFRIAFITHLVRTTGSTNVLSRATAVLLVPAIAFYIFGGAIGDRVRSRCAVMIAADLLRLAATAGAAVTAELTDNPVPFVAFALLVGVGSGLFEPIASGFVTQIVPRPKLVAANSAMSIAAQISLIIGPLLGGALIGIAGPPAAFWFDAATFGLSGLALGSIPAGQISHFDVDPEKVGVSGRKLFSEITEGFRYILGVRWLLITLGVGAFANAVFAGGLDVLIPLVFSAGKATGAIWLSSFYALEGAGALLGAVILSRLSLRGANGPLFGMLTLMSSSLALVGVFGRSYPSLVCAVTYGIGLHFFNALYPALVQATVPKSLISRVSSFELLAWEGLMPLGVLLMGPLSTTLGSRESLIVTGFAIAGLVLLAMLAPSIRSLQLPEKA